MAENKVAYPISHAHFRKGDVILREGDVVDCAYIVESGRVETRAVRDGESVVLNESSRGALVGEMALIGHIPSAFSVHALEDCMLLRISREDFARRMDGADPVLRMISQVILHRYRTLQLQAPGAALVSHFADLANNLAEADSSHAAALDAIKTGLELRDALTHHELALFYQPIIDVQNMRLAGFEALIRWRHPEKGMISPGIFIPVAEETGLIVDITRFALDQAARDIQQLKGAIREDIAPVTAPFISVNLSVKDFAGNDFFQEVARILKRHSTQPPNIHLEITESLLMDEPEKARETLKKCRDNGINVSIDDFGTGYSSLGYLHAFPIDTLKIDQSFIRSMRENSSSLVLVKSIVALARNLNMQIVAEGIETREEARVIRDLGCHKCQGYWFARPMPLEEAHAFARTWRPPSLWSEDDNA